MDPNKEAKRLGEDLDRIHHVHFDGKDTLKREIIELNKEWTKTDPSFRMMRMSGKSVAVDEFNLLDSASEEELYKELERFRRLYEIQDKANDARIARCEAKMKEVGKEKFMDLIHYRNNVDGEPKGWSDYEGRTEIEIEYAKLAKEQHDLAWLREFGKPWRMEDDPNAKF